MRSPPHSLPCQMPAGPPEAPPSFTPPSRRFTRPSRPPDGREAKAAREAQRALAALRGPRKPRQGDKTARRRRLGYRPHTPQTRVLEPNTIAPPSAHDGAAHARVVESGYPTHPTCPTCPTCPIEFMGQLLRISKPTIGGGAPSMVSRSARTPPVDTPAAVKKSRLVRLVSLHP